MKAFTLVAIKTHQPVTATATYDAMSSSLSRGNVSAQWDVGKTAFSSADRLRQLIGTATQDNVQPQAVLAAEALGFGLIVSPKRIDEAIVALGGTESTRIADLKVMIGLTSGGVVRTIRNSTALTQFFLVATACKLCYTSEEIGMLMFEMTAASGLLKKICGCFRSASPACIFFCRSC